MLEYIEKILYNFKSCFSRQSAFQWFVVIIVGLMTRSDKLGVTSIIRDLALNPKLYETMLHFFRASSWNLKSIKLKWFEVVSSSVSLYKEDGYTILIGDGVKQAKEGRYMPGVKNYSKNQKIPQNPNIYLDICLVASVFLPAMLLNGFVFRCISIFKTAFRLS